MLMFDRVLIAILNVVSEELGHKPKSVDMLKYCSVDHGNRWQVKENNKVIRTHHLGAIDLSVTIHLVDVYIFYWICENLFSLPTNWHSSPGDHESL